MHTIFDLCEPREDVLKGRVKDEEFAADLAAVVAGTATEEYSDPVRFFRHTYPTRGLKTLLETVCRRLSGKGGELNSVIRLDTAYGGGKTHSLIGLVHAVRGMPGVENVEEFVDPSLLPQGNVRVAALDGENADPANGLKLEDGLYAHSIWGEMAYRLAGRAGYERVRVSDEKHAAPGSETIIELFGGESSLILIDEVSVYLRKVSQVYPEATGQFTAFLHALIKAVSSTPKAALVMTLAVKAEDKKVEDAYRAEHQLALQAFAEAESIVSRKLLLLDPTAEDETVDILRRRLFEVVDIAKAKVVVDEYAKTWDRNKGQLCPDATSPEVRDQFLKGYPLHPETMNVMTEKMSSLSTFQRTRGMLRILARTVAHLWKEKPTDAFAIHPHHIDPSNQQLRDELTTRLGQQAFLPALASDVASVPGKDASTAQRLDQQYYPGQAPVTSYVARTIFLNTLSYGDSAQGLSADHLRYSVCSPEIEPTFVEAARKQFAAESLYLDDRPGSSMRFRVEANLTQIISREMREVDTEDLKNVLNSNIRNLFTVSKGDFSLVCFPAGPYEVPDDVGDGRPYLVILHYDAFSLSETPTELPQELVRMATRKGVNEETRLLQNNLVFVVADQKLRADMKSAMRRRLALEAIQNSTRMRELADYQQRKVKEEYEKSGLTAAIAILQCYRHLFYPSNVPIGSGAAKLGHTTIELQSVSDSPGNGQLHIKRALRNQKKLLSGSDQPDAPAYVRDQTPLRIKGHINTQELRNEFRRAPNLSILLDDDPIVSCIQAGIAEEVFIYREGDLVWGKSDPTPSIQISANAFVHTMENAKELKLWPRPIPKFEPEPGPDSEPSLEPGPEPGPPAPPPPPSSLSAEGPLRQALVTLFERARKQDVKAFTSVTMKFFEYKGAWDAHQAVATYRDAATECRFDVHIEGEGIESFELDFEGTLAKANAIKSFLQPHLQAAKDHNFEGVYTLTFAAPLATSKENGDAFIAAMTKYGGAEAYVEALAATEQQKKLEESENG